MTHEAEIAPHVSSRRAESTALRYFSVALAICFLIYLFPLVALRSGMKRQWFLSYWGGIVDTTYRDQHQDADIVIFGDSTAVTNIDPVRMTRDLGAKVLVLPNVSTSLPVSGYAPLVGYLRTNKQPKLIIFYLSGWDLDFLHNPFTEIVEEGEEMLLVHGSWHELLHYAAAKPKKMLMFPLHFYGSSNHVADLLYLRPHEAATLVQGHIVLLPHPTAMQKDCIFNLGRIQSGVKDTSAVEGVNQFTTPGTQTMVFISPIPRCKYLDEVEKLQHPGLQMPPLQVLPAASFREDGWQAHMLSTAIGPSTNYLETAIRQKLAGTGWAAPPR